MDLFSLYVTEEKLHKNFRNILSDAHLADRIELQRWCEGFPDRDNKFVKEFQTTFNSSFWEIYLFAFFREIGAKFDFSHHLIFQSNFPVKKLWWRPLLQRRQAVKLQNGSDSHMVWLLIESKK